MRGATLDAGDGGVHRLGCLGLVGGVAAGSEQQDPALDQRGEVLLDRAIDVGGRRRRRQLARERIEIAHLVLALPGELGLLLHRIGQMARHQCDDHEQREIDDLGWTRDEVGVEGRVEEIARPQHACDRRCQGRYPAKMPAGQQHRDQVDRRAPAHIEIADQSPGDDGRRRDHEQGDRDAT